MNNQIILALSLSLGISYCTQAGEYWENPNDSSNTEPEKEQEKEQGEPELEPEIEPEIEPVTETTCITNTFIHHQDSFQGPTLNNEIDWWVSRQTQEPGERFFFENDPLITDNFLKVVTESGDAKDATPGQLAFDRNEINFDIFPSDIQESLKRKYSFSFQSPQKLIPIWHSFLAFEAFDVGPEDIYSEFQPLIAFGGSDNQLDLYVHTPEDKQPRIIWQEEFTPGEWIDVEIELTWDKINNFSKTQIGSINLSINGVEKVSDFKAELYIQDQELDPMGILINLGLMRPSGIKQQVNYAPEEVYFKNFKEEVFVEVCE